jgi:hypothetical protein
MSQSIHVAEVFGLATGKIPGPPGPAERQQPDEFARESAGNLFKEAALQRHGNAQFVSFHDAIRTSARVLFVYSSRGGRKESNARCDVTWTDQSNASQLQDNAA